MYVLGSPRYKQIITRESPEVLGIRVAQLGGVLQNVYPIEVTSDKSLLFESVPGGFES